MVMDGESDIIHLCFNICSHSDASSIHTIPDVSLDNTALFSIHPFDHSEPLSFAVYIDSIIHPDEIYIPYQEGCNYPAPVVYF